MVVMDKSTVAKAHFHGKRIMKKKIVGEGEQGNFSRECIMCRGFLIKDEKIAVIHESKTDLYQLPGGGLEGEETLRQGCSREMLEETGYVVEISEFPIIQMEEYYGEWKFTGYYFVCETKEYKGTRLTEEEKQKGVILEWMTLDQALAVFGKYESYRDKDPMKYGGLLREYEALKMYLEYKRKREEE